jgi:hypothetical protein
MVTWLQNAMEAYLWGVKVVVILKSFLVLLRGESLVERVLAKTQVSTRPQPYYIPKEAGLRLTIDIITTHGRFNFLTIA